MRSNQSGPIKETDLYGPLREYLEARGYTVRSEVRDCDVVAERDGDIIVLEQKRSLSLALLAQAADRQRASDSVYVVVPHPGDRVQSRGWLSTCRLLRRLELGLVLVDLDGDQIGKPDVEIAFHPVRHERRTKKDVRRAVIAELHGRSADLNTGGSTGKKIVTAYRENAVRIACCLDVHGPLSPARLRDLGTGKRTGSILLDNFYKWFERVNRGVYALSTKGRDELSSYPELVMHYRAIAEKARLKGDQI